MGSLCSKASSDNFAGQGRPVGSAPAPAGTASVPKTVKAGAPKVGGPPRTLGGASAGQAGQAGGAAGDARSKAAAAAEVCLPLFPFLPPFHSSLTSFPTHHRRFYSRLLCDYPYSIQYPLPPLNHRR